ncbi:hypothetical protein WR25_22794 [Diploscapter pachys]|uniref:Uncharacterized protein n=1 Tax=Diploscapter pachys TaxID=2018661 RepID=A0A2A2JJF7_9BILA|nr:hypothetical protein WR25_22794 [Diploscapter pachys]
MSEEENRFSSSSAAAAATTQPACRASWPGEIERACRSRQKQQQQKEDRTTVLAFVIIEHNVRIDVKGEERRGENRRSTEAPVTAAAAVLTTPTSTELQGQRKGKGVKRPAADEKTHNNDEGKWGGVRRGRLLTD